MTLTNEELELAIKVAHSYPPGVDANYWGWGPLGDEEPPEGNNCFIEQFG